MGREDCLSGRLEVGEKMKSLILFPLHKTQSHDTLNIMKFSTTERVINVLSNTFFILFYTVFAMLTQSFMSYLGEKRDNYPI